MPFLLPKLIISVGAIICLVVGYGGAPWLGWLLFAFVLIAWVWALAFQTNLATAKMEPKRQAL